MNIKYSFIAWVILPTLVALLYYSIIATPQYVVESRFVVRSNQQSSQTDLLGALGSFTGQGSSSADAYILKSYIHSPSLINMVAKEVNIEDAFNNEVDPFSRLGTNVREDDLLDYWTQQVKADYDSTSGIMDLSVNAFTAEDAFKIASIILENSEKLINTLSTKARKDSLELALTEVNNAENRLAQARESITAFRNQHQAIDPAKTAEAAVGTINALKTELARAEAELISLRSYARSNAPAVKALETKVAGLKRQISNEENSTASGAPGDAAITSLLDEYEKLAVEHEFAGKLYESTLTSLEAARVEANKQQRYLAVFVPPQKPAEATEPKIILSTLTILFAAFLLWGIGSITAESVKDHIGWV